MSLPASYMLFNSRKQLLWADDANGRFIKADGRFIMSVSKH